jgi:shikimate 5-dehydrogenase
MVSKCTTDINIEYVCQSDVLKNDALVEALSEGSLVINGTGMGKDIPGFPMTDDVIYPMNGVVWEFNYRGELPFLHQAQAHSQEIARYLNVQDGWVYFLHGWTEVIPQVFHVEMTRALFNRLAALADSIR